MARSHRFIVFTVEARMMNGMMDRMMSGMGLVSILVVVVLLLAAAALLKYLFSR